MATEQEVMEILSKAVPVELPLDIREEVIQELAVEFLTGNCTVATLNITAKRLISKVYKQSSNNQFGPLSLDAISTYNDSDGIALIDKISAKPEIIENIRKASKDIVIRQRSNGRPRTSIFLDNIQVKQSHHIQSMCGYDYRPGTHSQQLKGSLHAICPMCRHYCHINGNYFSDNIVWYKWICSNCKFKAVVPRPEVDDETRSFVADNNHNVIRLYTLLDYSEVANISSTSDMLNSVVKTDIAAMRKSVKDIDIEIKNEKLRSKKIIENLIEEKNNLILQLNTIAEQASEIAKLATI